MYIFVIGPPGSGKSRLVVASISILDKLGVKAVYSSQATPSEPNNARAAFYTLAAQKFSSLHLEFEEEASKRDADHG